MKYLIILFFFPVVAFSENLKPKFWDYITPMANYEDGKLYHHHLRRSVNCIIGKSSEDELVFAITYDVCDKYKSVLAYSPYKIYLFDTNYKKKYYCPNGYCPVITIYSKDKVVITAPVVNGIFSLKNSYNDISGYFNDNKLNQNKFKYVDRFQIDYIYESDLK